MTARGSNLVHELGMEGFSVKPSELTLNSQLEYEFVTLAIKFCQEMEKEIKAKKISRRVTICEYIAKSAIRIVGGRRDKVENRLSKFVNCMDFRGKSKEIELYTWLCEINAGIKLVSIHNLIVKRFQTYDRDFMDSPRTSLKNYSHPLKSVIDIVGKNISQKSLRIFIEMIEGNPRTSSGGIRDKKIPAVVVIRAAIQSVYETSTISKKQPQEKRTEVFDYDEDNNDYYVKGKEASEDGENDQFYSESNYSYDEEDSRDEESMKKHDQDMQELTKIAHRYVFGNRGGLSELKKKVEEELQQDDMTEEELLEKKLKELEIKRDQAEERNRQYGELYEIVLDLFNKAKYNYTQFGKEIRYIENICNFFENVYDGDKTILKDVRHIKREEVPDMKKLKLVIGKCLERASNEIYNDDQPVFKFAIDREDYENDIDHRKKEAEFFELLNKSPPVPDQKGLRNARTRLREFQAVDSSSPLRHKDPENVYNMKGDDFKEFMTVLKSEYYKDFTKKNGDVGLEYMTDNDGDEEGEEEEDFDKVQMPPNILKGVAMLMLKIWRKGSKKKKKRRRSKSKSRSRSKGSIKKKKRRKRKTKANKPGPASPHITNPQESPQRTTERSGSPIFESPRTRSASKRRRRKKAEFKDVSPSPDGPTLEDTYSIPKKRRKVKKRVPKKLRSSPSKASKTTGAKKKKKKGKRVLESTVPGFSANVKKSSKSPRPVRKRKVGKFKAKGTKY